MAREPKIALIGAVGKWGHAAHPRQQSRELGDVVLFDIAEGHPTGLKPSISQGIQAIRPIRTRRWETRRERLFRKSCADVCIVTPVSPGQAPG